MPVSNILLFLSWLKNPAYNKKCANCWGKPYMSLLNFKSIQNFVYTVQGCQKFLDWTTASFDLTRFILHFFPESLPLCALFVQERPAKLWWSKYQALEVPLPLIHLAIHFPQLIIYVGKSNYWPMSSAWRVNCLVVSGLMLEALQL